MIPVFKIDCAGEDCADPLDKTAQQASILMQLVAVLLDDMALRLQIQAETITALQKKTTTYLKLKLTKQNTALTSVISQLETSLENKMTEQQVMINYVVPGIVEQFQAQQQTLTANEPQLPKTHQEAISYVLAQEAQDSGKQGATDSGSVKPAVAATGRTFGGWTEGEAPQEKPAAQVGQAETKQAQGQEGITPGEKAPLGLLATTATDTKPCPVLTNADGMVCVQVWGVPCQAPERPTDDSAATVSSEGEFVLSEPLRLDDAYDDTDEDWNE